MANEPYFIADSDLGISFLVKSAWKTSSKGVGGIAVVLVHRSLLSIPDLIEHANKWYSTFAPYGKYHGENEVAPCFCFIPKGPGIYLLSYIKAWNIRWYDYFLHLNDYEKQNSKFEGTPCVIPSRGGGGVLTIIFGAGVRLMSLAPTPFIYLCGVKNIPHSYTDHSEKHTSFTYLYTLWVKRYPIDILLKWKWYPFIPCYAPQ